MTVLSQDYCTVVAKYPLDNSLDHLRDSLRKAEECYESGLTNYDDAGVNFDQRPLKAVSRLLNTLQNHDVALTLHSKTENGDLASELYTLFRHVRNGNFNYEYYRVLLRLVIKKASNVDVWNAVFYLTKFISWTTPPSSISVSSTAHQSYTPPPRCKAMSRRRGFWRFHSSMRSRIVHTGTWKDSSQNISRERNGLS